MLVLQREVNETICIGGGVEITVVGIQRGRVKLGITAPRDLPVHRKEVWRQIQKEGKHVCAK